MTRRRPIGFALGAALAALMASGCGVSEAWAQVIEIRADGGVTRYDGPAVIDATGASAIIRPSRSHRSRPALSAAPAALDRAARDAGLSPELVAAVAWRESRMQPHVVSRAGAIGEMQLMPATARRLGVDPWDTAQNLHGGAAYLGGLLRRYDGDLVRALAAYNAGPGAVDRYGGPPPYRETRAYVADVLERLSRTSSR